MDTDVIDKDRDAAALSFLSHGHEKIYIEMVFSEGRSIYRVDSKKAQLRCPLGFGSEHRRPASGRGGQAQLGQRHPAAPAPDMHVLRWDIRHLDPETLPCYPPISPGSDVPQRDSGPLRQRQLGFGRERDQLIFVHDGALGEDADTTGCVVTEDLLRVTVLVGLSVAEYDREVAGAQFIYTCADVLHLYDTGVAQHYGFLAAQLANVHWART